MFGGRRLTYARYQRVTAPSQVLPLGNVGEGKNSKLPQLFPQRLSADPHHSSGLSAIALRMLKNSQYVFPLRFFPCDTEWSFFDLQAMTRRFFGSCFLSHTQEHGSKNTATRGNAQPDL